MPAPTKPAPKPAPKAAPAPAPVKTAAQLTASSPQGTSNRALILRRTLQDLEIEFKIPEGLVALLLPEQVRLLQEPTPAAYIKSHPGRGGMQFRFVPIALTLERLNMIFCYGWSAEVQEQGMITIDGKVVSVWVRGWMEIICQDGSRLRRPSFGGAEVEYYTKGDKIGQPLSIADNFKSATSDMIGKAASQFGLWLDVYDKEGDILRERKLAQEQTADLIAAASSTPSNGRVVETTATEVAPGDHEALFGADEPAEEVEMPVEDELEPADEMITDTAAEDEIAAQKVQAQAAAAKARPVPAPAPKPVSAAAAARATDADLVAMSKSFFSKAVAIGWKDPTTGQPAVDAIMKVLAAGGIPKLTVATMDKGLAVLQAEADKRRAASQARKAAAAKQPNGVHA